MDDLENVLVSAQLGIITQAQILQKRKLFKDSGSDSQY